MSRNILSASGPVFLTVALLGAAPSYAQVEGEAKPVTLTIIVPQKDATLWINDKAMKKRGTKRQFYSPPLKPGIGYHYILKVLWEPNNYTKITRSRQIDIEPGKSYQIDLSRRNPQDKPDDIKVRYVATPDEVVDKMLELAAVGEDDVVFDLGCGDGRIVARAVAMRGAKRGVGIDIDPDRIRDSRATAKTYDVEKRVEFREGDVLKQIDDLAEASVVMLYMCEEVNLQLRARLRNSLKPGSRVVSHRFTMGDWKPDKKIVVIDKEGIKYHLLLWTIKAEDGANKEPKPKP